MSLYSSIADWLVDISSGYLGPESNETTEDSNVDDGDGSPELAVEDGGVGAAGPSAHRIDQAAEQAKVRRDVLYEAWKTHYESLDVSQRIQYEPPTPSPLPIAVIKPSFGRQLMIHLERNFLIAWRK